jgi:hypothetical protein
LETRRNSRFASSWTLNPWILRQCFV